MSIPLRMQSMITRRTRLIALHTQVGWIPNGRRPSLLMLSKTSRQKHKRQHQDQVRTPNNNSGFKGLKQKIGSKSTNSRSRMQPSGTMKAQESIINTNNIKNRFCNGSSPRSTTTTSYLPGLLWRTTHLTTTRLDWSSLTNLLSKSTSSRIRPNLT